MNEEWFCEKLENLRIKENRLSTLAEILERLNETSHLNTKISNSLLSSPDLYNCLEEDANNIKLVDTICDILSICLKNTTFKNNSDLHVLLHRPLMHKQTRIRAVVLNSLLKELYTLLLNDECEGGDVTSIISIRLLHYVLLAIQMNETDVGGPAFQILRMVLKHYIDEPTVKDVLLEALKKSDVVKCRLYELAVDMACISAEYLDKIEFVLDHALSELDNDDVLVQSNILEILVHLAEINHGLSYLEKRQVFEVLGKRIEDLEQNPLDRMLIPGIMKFFGKISSVQPEKIIEGYPHMIRCLFQCLLSGDPSILPTTFDTLVNLTSTEHGVYLLDKNYGTAMRDMFEAYSEYLRNLPIALRCRALESLTEIFTFEKEPKISSILERWFSYLNRGISNMQLLMLFCRMPFPELKNSTLNLIHSVCSYAWGIECLKNTAGLLEFLLDRATAVDETSRYAKYNIISKLADSDAFDVQTITQLRAYVAQGPFYVARIVEVDVEGNE